MLNINKYKLCLAVVLKKIFINQYFSCNQKIEFKIYTPFQLQRLY